jgi:hypothetical protein
MHQHLANLAGQISTPNISDQAWMLILIGVIIGIWFGRRIR